MHVTLWRLAVQHVRHATHLTDQNRAILLIGFSLLRVKVEAFGQGHRFAGVPSNYMFATILGHARKIPLKHDRTFILVEH